MSAKKIWRWDVGASNVKPGTILVEADATDTFTTVTAAGYITQQEQLVWNFQKTDLVRVFYNGASIGEFQPSISNGVVTLNSLSGTVSGPTTVGDFAVFADTVGGLKDSNYLPSNSSLTRVAMANGATITNNFLFAADITGSLKDSGYNVSNILLTSTTNLTASQFNGMYATPVALTGMTAPGANLLLFPVTTNIVQVYGTTQFTLGGAIALQYENTAHGAGTLATATLAAATLNAATATTVYTLTPAASILTALAANQAVYISNQTQGFASGDSTFIVYCYYRVITI